MVFKLHLPIQWTLSIRNIGQGQTVPYIWCSLYQWVHQTMQTGTGILKLFLISRYSLHWDPYSESPCMYDELSDVKHQLCKWSGWDRSYSPNCMGDQKTTRHSYNNTFHFLKKDEIYSIYIVMWSWHVTLSNHTMKPGTLWIWITTCCWTSSWIWIKTWYEQHAVEPHHDRYESISYLSRKLINPLMSRRQSVLRTTGWCPLTSRAPLVSMPFMLGSTVHEAIQKA